MQDLKRYLKIKYAIELIPDPDCGGFVVLATDLKGCMSVGETEEECIVNIKDAMKEWMWAVLEDGGKIPEPKEHKEAKIFVSVE